MSIPSRGPTDYLGSWHRITKAHPLICRTGYRFQESRKSQRFFKRGRISQDALSPRQDFEQRADASLQIRTLPDKTLLMLLGGVEQAIPVTRVSEGMGGVVNQEDSLFHPSTLARVTPPSKGLLFPRRVPGSSYVLCRGRGRFCIWSFQPFQRADGQDN